MNYIQSKCLSPFQVEKAIENALKMITRSRTYVCVGYGDAGPTSHQLHITVEAKQSTKYGRPQIRVAMRPAFCTAAMEAHLESAYNIKRQTKIKDEASPLVHLWNY